MSDACHFHLVAVDESLREDHVAVDALLLAVLIACWAVDCLTPARARDDHTSFYHGQHACTLVRATTSAAWPCQDNLLLLEQFLDDNVD